MLTIAGMPLSPARRAISSMISTEVLGSSEEVGSSASSRSGSCIRGRAMATGWGWAHQGARHPGALALAARELVGALSGKAAEPDGIEQRECALDVGPRKPAQPGSPHPHSAAPPPQHSLATQ